MINNFFARLMPIPAETVDDLLPAGEVFTVRRVYSGEMQPDTVHKWSREYLLTRVRNYGAFVAGALKGSDERCLLASPSGDGGYALVLDPRPAPASAAAQAAVEGATGG